MALKHKTVGTTITQAEFEDTTSHEVDGGATGDILRVNGSGDIVRLPIGSASNVLHVSGGTPAWTNSITLTTLNVTSIIIGGKTIDTNEWAFLDGLDQAIKTSSSPTFAGLTVPSLGPSGDADLLSLAANALTVNGSAVFNEAGADKDFRVEAVGQENALFVQGSDGNVGIGTATPFQDVAGGTDDYSGTGLHLKGSAQERLIIEGTIAAIELIDLNSSVDEKIMSLVNSDGVTSFNSRTDTIGSNVDNILVMNHSTGRVGFRTDSPDEEVELHLDQNDDTILGVTNADGGAGARAIVRVANVAGSAITNSAFLAVGGTGYTGIPSWQDSGILGVGGGLSGGLRISSATGGVYFDCSALGAGDLIIDTSGIITMSNDLRVDGGNIGLTVDPDLITLASGSVKILGTLELENGEGNTLLILDQNAADEVFIDFEGATSEDYDNPISTEQGSGAIGGPKAGSGDAGWSYTGMIRIKINGTDKWIPYYSEDDQS